MLVLTRKASQRIVIDGRITITVVKLHGNRVCLGIEAPKEMAVNRAEVVFDVPNISFDAVDLSAVTLTAGPSKRGLLDGVVLERISLGRKPAPSGAVGIEPGCLVDL